MHIAPVKDLWEPAGVGGAEGKDGGKKVARFHAVCRQSCVKVKRGSKFRKAHIAT